MGIFPDRFGAILNLVNCASANPRCNCRYRREIQEQVSKLVKVEMAMEARFREDFVIAMAFPNKVEPFSRLREQVELPVSEPKVASRRRSRRR